MMPFDSFEFLGTSEVANTIRNEAEVAAGGDLTVLICGETGVGKELLANAIHKASARAEKGFVTVNCSAMPDTLVEAEFFGHMKGAFTGATYQKQGLCEAAHKGTIFLDEIGDMSLANQRPLLRFLSSDVDKREIRQVGGTATLHVNVRVIAATNKNLPRLIAEKAFREDLYFRLNVLCIHIPPLRERKGDIQSVLRDFSTQNGVSLSLSVVEHIKNHDWPGNFRQLKHFLEGSLARARWRMSREGSPTAGNISILVEDIRLPESMEQSSGNPTPPYTPAQDISTAAFRSPSDELAEFEKNLLWKTLEACRFNVSRTAARLGMGRKTLYKKFRAYGISTQKSFGDVPVSEASETLVAKA